MYLAAFLSCYVGTSHHKNKQQSDGIDMGSGNGFTVDRRYRIKVRHEIIVKYGSVEHCEYLGSIIRRDEHALKHNVVLCSLVYFQT